MNSNLTREATIQLKNLMVYLKENEKDDGSVKFMIAIDNKEQIIVDKCRELEMCRNERKKLLNKIATLENEKESIFQIKIELNNCRSELQHAELQLEILRETCNTLKKKITQYEIRHASYEERQKSFDIGISKLMCELAKTKEDMQDIRKTLSEERSLKRLSKKQYQYLERSLTHLRNRILVDKNQCIDYRHHSNNLTQMTSSLEEKISNYKIVLKRNAKKIYDLIGKNEKIKNEKCAQLSTVNYFNDRNRQIQMELLGAKKINFDLTKTVRELQTILNDKSNYYNQEEIKADTTIEQQTKLIDFLQSKIESCKKKRVNSTKKENELVTPIPLTYKDLENMLLQERNTNKSLQNEIDDLKLQLRKKNANSSRTKLNVLEKLCESPVLENKELCEQNFNQRMYHSIPHRFESKLCTNNVACALCGKNISLGRTVSYCVECCISVHPSCTAYVPKTCGLPQEYVNEFSENLTKLKENYSSSNCVKSDSEDVNIEGWIKVPTRENKGWDRKYACLARTILKIYAHPPIDSNVLPLETLELRPPDSHCMVILEPAIAEISTSVAASDIPFVIKIQINPNTTCWPPNSMIFMTLSVEDKQKWSKALNSIFQNQNREYEGDVIFKVPNSLDLNCWTELNSEIKLLGADQGLYSYQLDKLLHIAGPLHVYQISILVELNMCLMIADSNRYVISCNLNHLTSLTRCESFSKPTLIFKLVNANNLYGFHLFETSTINENVVLTLATSNQLIVMKYSQNLFEFVLVRILDTNQPTSCITFTEHSLIVGANKYFEIDLGSFEMEEFLDLSDENLCQVLLCYEIGSFPIAILKISNDPIEYLLCFNEFGVFVNEYGRHTRLFEMKWTKLPRAFYYSAPFLYVIQFTSIEIIKIKRETCNISKTDTNLMSNAHYLTMNNIQYLGNGKNCIYIVSEGKLKTLDGKKLSFIDTDKNYLNRSSFRNSIKMTSNESKSSISKVD